MWYGIGGFEGRSVNDVVSRQGKWHVEKTRVSKELVLEHESRRRGVFWGVVGADLVVAELGG